MIDGGDISALWTNAGWNNETLPTTGPLYYSSRGDVTEPRFDSDLNEYLSVGYLSAGEEYHYLFRNGEWVCYDMNTFEEKLPEVVEIPSPVAV